MSARSTASLPVLGWREWVSIPDWGIGYLKAKVDTGARTSSLHAFDLERFERDGEPWAGFDVLPWQRSDADGRRVEARVLDERRVRSSSGESELRPVVEAPIRVGIVDLTVELTLTRRDEMGFRMLLGRQAVRGQFLVDPGRSYLHGRPSKQIRAANRGRVARHQAPKSESA